MSDAPNAPPVDRQEMLRQLRTKGLHAVAEGIYMVTGPREAIELAARLLEIVSTFAAGQPVSEELDKSRRAAALALKEIKSVFGSVLVRVPTGFSGGG